MSSTTLNIPPQTLYVDGMDIPNHYTTLSGASTDAVAGDTIIVSIGGKESNSVTILEGIDLNITSSSFGLSGYLKVASSLTTFGRFEAESISCSGTANIGGTITTISGTVFDDATITLSSSASINGGVLFAGDSVVKSNLYGTGTFRTLPNGTLNIGGIASGFSLMDINNETTIEIVESTNVTIGSEGALTTRTFTVENIYISGKLNVNGLTVSTASYMELTGGTVNISAISDVTVKRLHVSGNSISKIDGLVELANVPGTSVSIERGSALAVSSEQFLEISKADIVQIAGMLIVAGSTEWRVLKRLETKNPLANISFTGKIMGVDVLKTSKNETLALYAERGIEGTSGGDKVTLDTNSSLTVSSIDMLGGKNALKLGANSSFKSSGGMANFGTITLDSGKSYKNPNGESVQGWTDLYNSGDFTCIAGKNTFTIGKFSNVRLDGGYGTTLSNDINSTIKIDSGSIFTVVGNALNINAITLGNYTSYVNGKDKNIIASTTLDVSGTFYGTAKKDKITLGKLAVVKLGGLEAGDGADSISIGSNSKVSVTGNVIGVSSINLAASSNYKNSSGITVAGETSIKVEGAFMATAGTDKITLGKNTSAFFGGTVDFLAGNNSIAVSANSKLEFASSVVNLGTLKLTNGSVYKDAAGMKVQGYTICEMNSTYHANKMTVTLGNYTRFIVGGALTSVKMSIQTGSSSSFDVSGIVSGMNKLKIGVGASARFEKDFVLTDKNDSIATGKDSAIRFDGDLNFGSGSSDSLAIGDGGSMRISGYLTGVYSVKLGKGSKTEASTEAVAAMISCRKFSAGTGAVIYDIGSKDAAMAFTSAAEELSDNSLESNSSLVSGSNGWLSGAGDRNSLIKSYQDDVDYFKLTDGNGNIVSSLDGWKIEGNGATLEVRVWTSNGAAWNSSTVSYANGMWDLSNVDISKSSDYRISVGIVPAANDIYSYNVSYIA